ncbi:MAG: type IV secretory system conjugative DNA transfer family protein [Erysipelotrichaceae bacterium]|nr:type IV secretory system conjugative DNA transfer family protein [Erysipelotrichaceae bacterium]
MKKVFLHSWPGIIIGVIGSFSLIMFDYLLKGLNEAETIFNYHLEFRSDYLDRYDLYALLICMVIGYLWVVCIYLNQYSKGQRDFSLSGKKNVTDLSADKKLAQDHPVPKKYLSKKPDGLTIGRKGRKYVRLPFEDSPKHQLILGSPGSGKSTTLLNALLWNFNFEETKKKLCSVLAIDVKPELQKKSSFQEDPNIRIIDPTSVDKDDPCNFGFDLWYGLTPSDNDDRIKERAESIARSIIPDLSGDNAHFSGNAQKILSGFLMYGFVKGLSFSDTIAKVMSISVKDFIAEIITDPEMKDHPKIVNKVKVFDGNDSNEMASIKDTMEKDLNIFDTESVKYCFSGNKQKVTPQLLSEGKSVFLTVPDHLLTTYKTVFGLIMELSLNYLMSIPEEKLRNRNPIWCLIDEGGTVYVPSLEDVAARGRSKKIQLSLIVQSYAQLENLYGDRKARSILDCCKTTIVFSCNDNKTADTISKWCGYYRETKYAYSNNPSSYGQSTNSSIEYRPVMDISDIKSLERDNEVLAFVNGDWFKANKAPYYSIRQLSERSDQIISHNLSSKESI